MDEAHDHSSAGGSRRWSFAPGRLFLHLSIAIAVQAAALLFLERADWIRPLLPWDDVAFIARGIQNYDGLARDGSYQLQIHALLGDLQALAGLALFRLDVRGPYLLNFVYVAAATLSVSYYFRRRAMATRGFATGLVLAFTPLHLAILQLKSDHKGGLFLAIGLLLLFEPQRRGLGGAGRVAVIGSAFVLALAGKLTAIYLPLVVGGAVVLRGTLWRIERKGWSADGLGPGRRSEVARYALLVAIIAVGYGAIVLPRWEELYGYVRFALSEKWDAEGVPWYEHLLFYTPFGITGRYWLGHGAMGLALGAYVVWRGRMDRSEGLRLASLALVLGVLYVPLLLDQTHNPDFGSYAFFTSLAAGLFLLRLLPDLPSSRVGYAAAAGIPLALFLGHRNPLFHWHESRTVAHAESSLAALSDAIAEDDRGRRVTFVFDTLLLPYPNLLYAHYRRHRSLLETDRVDDFSGLPRALSTSDYVLAIDDPAAEGLLTMRAWTNNRRVEEILGMLRGDAEWVEIASVPFHDFSVKLFSKR